MGFLRKTWKTCFNAHLRGKKHPNLCTMNFLNKKIEKEKNRVRYSDREVAASKDRSGKGEGKGRKGLLGGANGSGVMVTLPRYSIIVCHPRCSRSNRKL